MTTTTADPVKRALGFALMCFPCLFVLVFLMHFRHPEDLLHFHLHYVQRDPARTVAALIQAHNNWPLVHDPHVLGYLGLPLIPLCAFAMYVVGKNDRPASSALAMMITVTGTIYLGGVFGMWTAFYRGIGLVDPSQTQGAIETFKALTTNQGAFFLTTTLAKLSMIGFALQALTLSGKIPAWAVTCIVLGAGLFLAFWDLDNWMLIGTLLMMAGFVAVRRKLVVA